MPVGDGFAQRIVSEQDDLLSTLQLVAGNRDLENRLLERLVDLLLEGLFFDLRNQLVHGQLTDLDHRAATAELAAQARAVGLIPFATE